MNGLYSAEDFIAKIDWEGGISSALDYGLTTKDYDLPVKMAEKWDELRDLWGDVESAEAEFYEAVAEAGYSF